MQSQNLFMAFRQWQRDMELVGEAVQRAQQSGSAMESLLMGREQQPSGRTSLLSQLKQTCEARDFPLTGNDEVRAEHAAALLGLAPQTLANMRSRGEGPRFEVHNRRVFYSLPDLAAYRAENSDQW